MKCYSMKKISEKLNFCLSFLVRNYDMDSLIQELIQRRTQMSDRGTHFYHAACTFLPKKCKKLTYGMNHFTCQSRLDLSVHAEIDALTKLKPRQGNKQSKKINLLIIRTTKHGKLCMSKPCPQCCQDMTRILPRLGYKLDWIYYSTASEEIHRMKLDRTLS